MNFIQPIIDTYSYFWYDKYIIAYQEATMDNETKSIYTSALEIADKIDQHLIKQSVTH